MFQCPTQGGVDKMEYIWLITDVDGDKYAYRFNSILICQIEENDANTYNVFVVPENGEAHLHEVDARSKVKLVSAESFSWS